MRSDGSRPSGDRVPSDAARQRLEGAVRREVAELKVRLSEASLRSDAFLEMGAPDAAAEAVAEQQQLLDDFRERVECAVSGAAVEREAERVVADELARQQVAAPESDQRRLRAPLSAAVAAGVAALLAMVVSGGPVPSELLGVTPTVDGAGPTLDDPGSAGTHDGGVSGTAESPVAGGVDAATTHGRSQDELLDRAASPAPRDPAPEVGILDRLLAGRQVPMNVLSALLPKAEELPPFPSEAREQPAEEEPSEEAPPTDAHAEPESDGEPEPDESPSGEGTSIVPDGYDGWDGVSDVDPSAEGLS